MSIPLGSVGFRAVSRILAVILLASGLLTVVPGLGRAPAQAAVGDVMAFPVPGSTDPIGITGGPSGTVWFTDANGQIGQFNITPLTGAMHTPTTTASNPSGIVLGSDGNLWFTETAAGTNQIGVMTPAGTMLNELSIPTTNSQPTAITRATDNSLWFTEFNVTSTAQVGRVATPTSTVTDFPVALSASTASTFAIAPGANGTAWFTTTNNPNPQVGHIDSTGAVTVTTVGSSLDLRGITVGGDGFVYFAEASTGAIGRLDPSNDSVTTTYKTLPGTTPVPLSMTTGPDGNVYFTAQAASGDFIGRLTTPGGAVVTFPTGLSGHPFSTGAPPTGISSGPDGNIWATAQTPSNQILRLQIVAPTATGSLTPGSLSFGNQNVNTTSTAQTATFSISGGAGATISSAPSASGDFAVTGGTCTNGLVLAAGGSCTVTVAFTPKSAGSRAGTLTVASTASGGPFQTTLSGTGVAGGGGGTPSALVSPAITVFFSQAIATTSTAHTVTLTNNGGSALAVSSVIVTGTMKGDFVIVPGSDHCSGASVAASGSCTVQVAFVPTAEGVRFATLMFTDNASTSPQVGGLLGRGVHQAGYWLTASDGGIFSFPPGAPFLGSTGNIHLNKPIVGMAATPDGGGYWLVATDGGIFAFGDALFHGSTGSIRLNSPIVAMAATPSGNGYWLVAADGGIFAFGDALFYGSTGSIHLNKPIVGMAATQDGGGYWLVATDGGIFAFGDALFHGSTGSIRLNQPIVGMAPTLDGSGYWLVASDGGIFAFNAPFLGSTASIKLNKPIVGMAATPTGQGYWMVATDGGIFAFPDAKFFGSTGSIKLNQPIVGMAPIL